MDKIGIRIRRLKNIPIVRVMMQKNVQMQGIGMLVISLLLIAPATTNYSSHVALSNIGLFCAFLLSLFVGYLTADKETK